jgi:twitching motility protein PilT
MPAASQPIARSGLAAANQPAASAGHGQPVARSEGAQREDGAQSQAVARVQAVQSSTSQRITPVATPAFAALVKAARDRRASDLHVSAGRVTSVRVGVDLVPLEPGAPPLSATDAEALLAPLIDGALHAQLERIGYVDFALEAPGGGRLRANICRQQQGLKGTFRLAMTAPLPLEALGLPAELSKVVGHHQGLVVIAGPSGHGKTTTLAALVDLVNSTKPHHILTIEDPIELVHARKQAVISQREVGRDTVSFARGLKASLREDPDVIVIGELRDRESVEIALTAAETGHLVLATMSTPSAAKTIDRLVDMFPPEEHSQVRASVAGALRAIVAQRLLPKKGGGVVPAIELVTGVLPLAVLIREDKLYQLPNLMQRGRAFGMIRFDESLIELVRTGKIDEETALAYAESRKDFAAQLQSKTAVMWKVPPK